ncbi:MAG TPA: PAS domain-containing protein [Rhizomicrobium sp.]|nr:PAS domain-containing protein [Rhizomicrobium sp.]
MWLPGRAGWLRISAYPATFWQHINRLDRCCPGLLSVMHAMLCKPARTQSTAAINRPTYSIDDVEHPIVKSAVSYWQSVRAQRRFPARADLTLRGMASFLPYTLIVAVIENGNDYEYRFVGDAERQAFKRDFKGMRVSQIEKIAPKLGETIRATYDKVSATGLPFAVRGLADHVRTNAYIPYHEAAFLPLGVTDGSVDHFLAIGVNIERPVSQPTG